MLVIGGGAKRPAQRGFVEQQLQAADDQQRAAKHDQRHHADAQAADADTRHLKIALGQFLTVGAEEFQQHVLHDDRQAERHQQRRQNVRAQRAVEQQPLKQVAETEHQRHHDQQTRQRTEAQMIDHHQRQVRRQHDEVAMGDVDQAHDAEHQRQPHREHRVQATEQHALKQSIEPFHH
ncbi:hypothetical protein D3C87_1668830 [compost metagenome]